MADTPPQQDIPPGPGYWKASDGNWYPPQQQAPYGAPPQKKKGGFGKGCLLSLGIGAGLLVILFIIIAVAASNSTKDDTKPGEGSKTNPATADVSVQQCNADQLGFVHASGTIQNHSSKPSSYLITISFNDAQGNRIAEGNHAANVIQPGQSASFDAIGSAKAAPAQCVVAKVTRLAS